MRRPSIHECDPSVDQSYTRPLRAERGGRKIRERREGKLRAKEVQRSQIDTRSSNRSTFKPIEQKPFGYKGITSQDLEKVNHPKTIFAHPLTSLSSIMIRSDESTKVLECVGYRFLDLSKQSDHHFILHSAKGSVVETLDVSRLKISKIGVKVFAATPRCIDQ